MTYWTLEYGGSEMTRAAWGFAQEGLTAEFGNMVVDTFNVQVPLPDVTADEIIPYEGQVIIRSGRISSEGSFSGGAVEFQGKRLLHILHGQPGYEGVVYQFGGPGDDLASTPFQQASKE